MAGVATSSRQRSKIAPYLMILPALVYLGIFFVWPIISLARTSLSTLAARCSCRRWSSRGTSATTPTRSARIRTRSCGRSPTPRRGHGGVSAAGLPARIRHRVQGGPVQEPHPRAGDPAVLRDVPDPHHRVENDSGRRRLGGQRARLDRPAAQRGPTAVDQLGGDRRADLQLDHLHDPAALRQPGEDRSATDRGDEGSVLQRTPAASPR